MPHVFLQWKNSRPGSRYSCSGFSMVELLVVISVIAILAAITFPVFARVRAKSKDEVCMSNLRQIHLATALYTHDYDGLYPYAITEHYRQLLKTDLANDTSLAPYMALPSIQSILQSYSHNRNIFHCPDDVEKQLGPHQVTNYATYGLSYFYDIGIGLKGQIDSNMDDYTKHELADDVRAGWHTPGEDDMQARRGNVLFLDGHVRPYTFQQQLTDYFGVSVQ